MDIESLVTKYERLIPAGAYTLAEGIRAALTEADGAMAMEHNFKMLQVEATMQNLGERIRQLEADLAESRERIRQLEGALEIIAGRKQCIDNTMGNADVAMAMLAAAPAKEGE